MNTKDELYNVIRDGMHLTVYGSELKETDVIEGVVEPLIVKNADSYDLGTREQDTREQLEADVASILRNAASHTSINTSIGDMLRYTVPGSGVAPWQTEEDACEALAAIAERQNAELTAERDGLQAAIDAMGNRQFYAMYRQACDERDALAAKVDELNAHWRKSNDGWAEANAEAERWRQKCDHMQRVIDTRRDSFLKMEREYRELQDVCGELERTLENLRGMK